MSHAFAARGARQTAVLATIAGLHFVVFLIVANGFGPREINPPKDPGGVTLLPPKPVEPEEVLLPPSPGPIDEYHVGTYSEPLIQFPDFTPDKAVTVPDREGVAGEGAGAGPTVVVVPPALRTRPANVAAAINACYPAASRRLNEEGRVIALVTIGASGSAVNWSVARSSGFSRLDAAIGCVLGKLDFVAGRRDGQAVSADATLPIVFQLD